MSLFILSLAEADNLIKNKNSKRDLFYLDILDYDKIVLTLLTKIVIVYIGLTIIKI